MCDVGQDYGLEGSDGDLCVSPSKGGERMCLSLLVEGSRRPRLPLTY